MVDILNLRLLCGLDGSDSSRDALFSLLVGMATSFASEYTGLESADVPELIVCMMACEDFGRVGSGGVSYKSFSHIAENYRADYSPEIYKLLDLYRRVKVPCGNVSGGE